MLLVTTGLRQILRPHQLFVFPVSNRDDHILHHLVVLLILEWILAPLKVEIRPRLVAQRVCSNSSNRGFLDSGRGRWRLGRGFLRRRLRGMAREMPALLHLVHPRLLVAVHVLSARVYVDLG